jgi:hypothetical protein
MRDVIIYIFGIERHWPVAVIPRSRRYVCLSLLIIIAGFLALAIPDYPPYSGGKASANSVTDQVIERARAWVLAGIPYSMQATYQGYRTDCSGFVSFAWGLPSPGLTTDNLDAVALPIPKEALHPGDILNNRGNGVAGHTLIFAGWNDSNRSSYAAYEMSIHARYGSRAHYAESIPYPYWSGEGDKFVPMRLQAFASFLPLDGNYLSYADRTGPTFTKLVANPNPLRVNSQTVLKGTVDDKVSGGSKVRAGQYSVDGGPWLEMSSARGKFDQPSEDVTVRLAGFNSVGVKKVCGRGADEPGNIGEMQCITVEVFDPNAGFVTGQGNITSPLGAYLADPSLRGDAAFSFLSQYEKDAVAPSGHAELHLGPFHFNASSQRVLYVSGSRAQLRGTGDVNDQPGYGFSITMSKGRVSGGDGIDRLRLKVWKESDGTVVYDNVRGFNDDLDSPTLQEMSSGAVVINK